MSAFSAPWDSCRRVRSSAPPKPSKPRSKKSWAYYLATLLEEIFQQFPGRRFGEAAIDLRPMMAARRSKKLHAIFDRPALGVGSAIIEAANPCERQRGCAHGAGLERDIDITAIETLGAEPTGGVTDGDHFGVRRGVAVGQRAIAGARNHLLAAHQHTADRHLVASAG